MVWNVLYVKSRAEKKVSERLENDGVEVFCPLKTEVRQWSDRKKKVKIPYFPSYVFVRFEKKKKPDVLKTPGVVGFVYWLRKPAVIREQEMRTVMDFFKDRKDEKISFRSFKKGDRLKIERGPLKERKGVVLRQTKEKVVLQIEQLGVVLTAEVPKDAVSTRG